MTVIELDEPKCNVRLVRSPRARRFTLRLENCGSCAVLTQPKGVSLSESRAFLMRHSDWLRRALDRQPKPTIVGPGVLLPIDGKPVTVVNRPGRRRAPHLEGDELIIQGSGAEGTRIRMWLKERARQSLVAAAHRYAGELDRCPGRVMLRDTRSRWGSCSSSGTLSFSWRLAMAPADVREYVAAHEAAHLVEMNHSARFWSIVDHLYPDWQTRRDWLKREGRALHAYRFDAS